MQSDYLKSVTVNLAVPLMEVIDKIHEEWDVRSRADIAERILHEVLTPDFTHSHSSNPDSNRTIEWLSGLKSINQRNVSPSRLIRCLTSVERQCRNVVACTILQ